jgi:TonB-linked SusC/RagA family outer membrane protein
MKGVGSVWAALLFALALLPASPDAAVAQQPATIAGSVVNATNLQPLAGALVFIPGTNRSALTNAQGRFLLTGVEGPAGSNVTLQVQLIGYATASQQVPIGAEDVRIAMTQTAIQLEGVVVSALGIEREARALGYSVASATPEQLTQNRTPHVMDALAGKVAGVSITPLGTGPQGSSKVRIRGQSSIGANNSPLVVVNGVPLDNTTFGVSADVGERGRNRNTDTGDGLSSINPDDIVDMTVLKGAAASALYGARAKDGVIMITTRNRARGDGVQFELNTNFMHETPLDYRDFQFEYGLGENGCRPLRHVRPQGTPESGGRPCPLGGAHGVWSFGERIGREPNMTMFPFPPMTPGGRDPEIPYESQPNQVKQFYRNGLSLTNTITVSQGSATGGFSASVSNLTSQGIYRPNEFTRNTANLGFTQAVGERLRLAGNVNYAYEDRQSPPNIAEQDYSTPVILYTMGASMPMSALEQFAFREDGQGEQLYTRFNNRTNPYFTMTRMDNSVRDRIYGNLTASYQLLPWLSAQGRVGQDQWSRDHEYNTPSGAVVLPVAPAGFVNGQYVQDFMSMREVNADFLLRGGGARGVMGLDATFGGNVMRRSSERQNTQVDDFYQYGVYSLSNGRVLAPQYTLNRRQVNSLYGSAEVSFRDLLFVTGTARQDWFSTLAPGNRGILYPSISTSLVFTDLMQAPYWLDFGKIRAAYAEVGSDTDVPAYADVLFYGINQNLFHSFPLGSVSGNVVPNPALRPMRLAEWEIGTELSLFDRVRLDVGYYHRIGRDQILNQQISTASGFSTRRVNIGETENRGVEGLLDASLIRTPRFSWGTTFNANYNTSKVNDLGLELGVDQIQVGTADFHGSLRQVVGMPMNQLYGRGWQRDDQGRVIHNPSGVPLGTSQELNWGSSLPKWVGGITNNFEFAGVTASALVDFKLGHKLISGTHTNAVRHGNDASTLVGREQGCVVGEGVNQQGQPNTACTPLQQYYESIRTYQTSEQSVFNAGYWQLRQITLGYDVTPHLGGALGLQQVRLNLAANNVALLKKWVPHVHPEQNGIFGDHRMGLESTGMPITRGIGLNVNVRF